MTISTDMDQVNDQVEMLPVKSKNGKVKTKSDDTDENVELKSQEQKNGNNMLKWMGFIIIYCLIAAIFAGTLLNEYSPGNPCDYYPSKDPPKE